MAKKTFVLDTNVLLYDPDALFGFKECDIVIPLAVLEELDLVKKSHTEVAKRARLVLQHFEELKRTGKGDLHQGIKRDEGGVIRVQLQFKNHHLSSNSFSLSHEGYQILATALFLQEKGERVVFVSNDLAIRIKAQALGLETEEYASQRFCYEQIPKGFSTYTLDKARIDEFLKNGTLSLSEELWHNNEYCLFSNSDQSTALGCYNKKKKLFHVVPSLPKDIWGISPVNIQQRCALDLLFRDDVKLVTLLGPAGTGKTLLALAAGLRQVFDETKYTRILVSRPIVPLGRDIGYLPGVKEEKLAQWMQPIYDNLEFLCAFSGSDVSETLRWVTESKKLEMEAVTYIRGRSLPQIYIIIDEAQNLTPHEIKTIISRAGKNTKVVLTGDPTQIDTPYLDKDSNGLTYATVKLQDSSLCGHLYLEKTERSPLAALAAELM